MNYQFICFYEVSNGTLAFALALTLAAALATKGGGAVRAGELGGHVAGSIGVLGVGDELELNDLVGGEGLEAIVALGGLDDVLVDDDNVLGIGVGGDEVVDGDEANSLVVEPLSNLAGVLLLGVDGDFGHLGIWLVFRPVVIFRQKIRNEYNFGEHFVKNLFENRKFANFCQKF